MAEYFHSVTLDKDKCKGCTSCIKGCPTEAIRVRNGKARIMPERCIDCGECIRVCPYHAKVAITDPLLAIDKYRYKIVLPAPTLYGQFKNLESVEKLLLGLKMMGFDGVYEVAKAADLASGLIKNELNKKNRKRPLISSACPAIVRLIQLRFPELIDNIVNVESPMEIAGLQARVEFCEQNSIFDENEVGVFFVTPCAAKVTAIRNPITKYKSSVDGAISIVDVYGTISSNIKKIDDKKYDDALVSKKASFLGVGWANSGGESSSLLTDNFLAVDGIQNVLRVLEEIENNKFTDLDFFEGLSCTGGCVGGPLVFENGFVAKNRIKRLVDRLGTQTMVASLPFKENHANSDYYFKQSILPRSVLKLDNDLSIAIKKVELIEKIHSEFPGLDCGSCGSPNCKSLAEDIVRGLASDLDCIFKLREKVKKLAQEMIGLSEKIPGGETNGDSNSN